MLCLTNDDDDHNLCVLLGAPARTRRGSQVPLMTEVDSVFGQRNLAFHEGKSFDDPTAAQAIEVARGILQEMLPQVLAALPLSLDETFVVSDVRV